MTILESIESVRSSFRADLDSFLTDQREIEQLRSKYFGRKGLLADLYNEMANLDADEKPNAGQAINALKKELQGEFDRSYSKNVSHNKNVHSDQVDHASVMWYMKHKKFYKWYNPFFPFLPIFAN